MRAPIPFFYHVVAEIRRVAITICFILCGLAVAQAQGMPDMDALFRDLAAPEGEGWRIAESDIVREWSKSGSPAMDLLLKRGEQSLDEGDIAAAIGHLTALTDHAPDFAAGWQARAIAYAASGLDGPAVSDLHRALELEPRHFGALAQLGAMLEEMEEYDGALAAFRESLKIHPHQQDVNDAVTRLERRRTGTEI